MFKQEIPREIIPDFQCFGDASHALPYIAWSPDPNLKLGFSTLDPKLGLKCHGILISLSLVWWGVLLGGGGVKQIELQPIFMVLMLAA